MYLYRDDYEYDESFVEDPYEDIRDLLAPAYQQLPPEDIKTLFVEMFGEDISPEEMAEIMGFLRQAGQTIGRVGAQVGQHVVKRAPQILSGAVSGATTGAALGPWGALGGALVGAGAGALGPAGPATGTPGGAPPQRRRPAPRGRRRPRGGTTGAMPAATQLLSLLSSPAVQQAVMQMMMGQAGNSTVPAGGTRLPVTAVTNLLGMLANQASAEYNAVARPDMGESIPYYLMGADGEFLVDPASPEQRATLVMELLVEDMANEGSGDIGRDLDEAVWELHELIHAYAY